MFLDEPEADNLLCYAVPNLHTEISICLTGLCLPGKWYESDVMNVIDF